MKKLVIYVLVAAFLTVTCGCQSKKDPSSEVTSKTAQTGNLPANFNPTGDPIVKDKITLKIFCNKGTSTTNWDNMPFWTEMEKKTNIHFTFDLADAKTYVERKNLLLASGDYPDIFYAANITSAEELTYGQQGVLQRLDPLIDKYAPNIKKFYDDYPSYKKMTLASDGNIYSLPYISTTPRDTVFTKAWINNVWLKNLGLEMPKTIDDLYNVLKAFKEKDPNRNGQQDEIPVSFTGTGNNSGLRKLSCSLLSAFGVVQGQPTYDVKDGKVYYIAMSDGYKAYLTFMNKLLKESILDREAFTQTSQQFVSKGNQQKIGFFADSASYIVDKQDQYEKYTAVPPLTSSMNSTQMWANNNSITCGGFSITNKNKYPEASIRWIDYFFTEEGGAFLSQGPEGLGWKYIDGSRSKWDKIIPSGYASSEEYRMTLTPNAAYGGATPGVIPGKFLLGLNAPHVIDLESQIAKTYLPYLKESFPKVKFTEAEEKEVARLQTDIEKYVYQMESRFILGDASLDTWNNYLANLKKMNVDRLLSIQQGAYDKYLKAK